MGKINLRRVLIGGLVAGLVINIFEFVRNTFFLGAEWHETLTSAGRHSLPGAALIFLIWGFLMGIGAIWLYAAARPRFGPGIKTAVLTGVAFWALSSALCAIDEAAVGMYPLRLVTVLALVCLVQAVVASVAGAWFYRE